MDCFTLYLFFSPWPICWKKFIINDLWHAKIVFSYNSCFERMGQSLLSNSGTRIVEKAWWPLPFFAFFELLFHVDSEGWLNGLSFFSHELYVLWLWRATFLVELCFLVLGKQLGVNEALIIKELIWKGWTNSIHGGFLVAINGFIIPWFSGEVLRKVLIPCFSKRGKPSIDDILLSFLVGDSSLLIFTDGLLWNPMDPSFIFITILPMSVAVMGDVVVHRWF